MIYVFVVPFLVLVILSFVLLTMIKQTKKRDAAFVFGKSEFDVELPRNPNAYKELSGYQLPPLQNCSDAESFMLLIIPYLGSLKANKRDQIHKEIEALSTNLKMNKEIYRAFMDEYEKYEGLSGDQASNKWRGKA
tara:strand:+ start:904 stop:1308 length:405 start_codon:yes stop_codon:yes gene_type:complete